MRYPIVKGKRSGIPSPARLGLIGFITVSKRCRAIYPEQQAVDVLPGILAVDIFICPEVTVQ